MVSESDASLAAVISTSLARFPLLAGAALATGPNPTPFGGDYQRNAEQVVAAVRVLFLRSYRSFDGQPLLRDNQLRFGLLPKLGSLNARVSGDPTGVIAVEISLGLFAAIDLLAAAKWIHPEEVLGPRAGASVTADASSFTTAASAEFSRVLGVLFPDGAPLLLKARLFRILTSRDETMQEWAADVSLGLLWVLAHEVGHLLCGHSGYFGEAQGMNAMSENLVEPSGGASLSVQHILLRSSSELMADAYATLRMFSTVVTQIESGDWAPESRSHLIGRLATAASLPALAFILRLGPANLPDQFGGDAANILIEMTERLYPSPLCRLFNLYATTYFLLFPLGNALVDSRPNPLTERLRDACGRVIASETHMSVYLLDHFAGAAAYLRALGAIPPGTSFEALFEDFSGSLVGSQQGVVVHTGESFLAPHMFQWSLLMHRLCTELNLYFSFHLYEWTGDEAPINVAGTPLEGTPVPSSGGLTRDPAYKILDDWMSNILLAAQLPEEADKVRQSAAARGVWLTKVWKSM